MKRMDRTVNATICSVTVEGHNTCKEMYFQRAQWYVDQRNVSLITICLLHTLGHLPNYQEDTIEHYIIYYPHCLLYAAY